MLHELPILDGAGDQASTDTPSSRKKTWRGFEDRENSEEYRSFTEGEFMPGAAETPSRTSRRKFLEIMGASMAMAGMAACRKPVERIVPYTRAPEEVIPGKSEYYATAMPLSGIVRGVLVESHEGRPTKVEGNPEHPENAGEGTGVYEQASVLTLYDPDRSQTVYRNGEPSTWEEFQRAAQTFVDEASNRQIAVIAEPTSSPTRQALRSQLEEQYGQVRWIDYGAEGEEAKLQGAQMAFGQPLRPYFHFSEAEVIVSLDADFLGPAALNHPNNTRRFAESRQVEADGENMNRLYVIENTHSVTGGMADNRLRLRASEIPAFAAALAEELGIDDAPAGGQAFADHPWVGAVAEDLREHAGQGIVLAGDGQPAAVHALCALINQELGNAGQTVEWLDVGAEEVVPQMQQIEDLIDAVEAEEVDALLMLGTNPLYSLPPDLNFEEVLQSVPESIHLGLWRDETAQQSTWHLPRSYYLESWADGRSYRGVLSAIQPLIAPLYDTRSAIELLNLITTGEDVGGHDLVREVWQNEVIPEDFDATWRRVLHDGYLADTQYSVVDPGQAQSIAGALDEVGASGESDLELVFRKHPHIYDGRFANNAWMQEQPHPVTKITWDNVALMSRPTAEALDLSVELEEGRYYVDVIELTHDGHTLELPVWILPGHADDSITVSLGYGRQFESPREGEPSPSIGIENNVYRAGPLANGVGQNTYQLRSRESLQIARGVEVEKVGERYMIATTQDHGSMEGRDLVRWAEVEEYRENPEFAQEADPESLTGEPWQDYPALWESEEQHPAETEEMQERLYADYQWGMAIDLNTCTGCGACITACTSENNVPVVGKEQVSRGREMHWLRMDRYFTGDDPDDPGMVMQAMLCMHCENAPCEPVCPVAATSHSADGINEMTYNRCIGTRYCSNNCPWKIRRFNFLNWTSEMPEQMQMAMNPNVTLRFRGVMEKCTYCVHRVREVGRNARNEEREIRDGEIQTACQQACPARAITFGDISDPNTEVSQLKENERNYITMGELGTRPRTSYLARVNNPNPQLQEST